MQAALLKLIEGSEVSVPAGGSRRNPNAEYVTLDTTDILFVCGGAFDALTSNQGKEKHPIGFYAGSAEPEQMKENPVNTKRLVKYVRKQTSEVV